MNDNNSYVLDVSKVVDYFLDMIHSYYPEFKPSQHDLDLWREGVYEMMVHDNRKFEDVKEVIDFISMNNYWRTNISNLKQVRNRFQEIMRDKRVRESRARKELLPKEDEAKTKLKKIVNTVEKKERSKERKEPL